jgi:hypothetical protein
VHAGEGAAVMVPVAEDVVGETIEEVVDVGTEVSEVLVVVSVTLEVVLVIVEVTKVDEVVVGAMTEEELVVILLAMGAQPKHPALSISFRKDVVWCFRLAPYLDRNIV